MSNDKQKNEEKNNKTRVTLEQARKTKGQSNVARLYGEQLKEKIQKKR